MTWSLWATLQGGDEKIPAIQEECSKLSKDLISKWGLPPDLPIRLNSTLGEVLLTLTDQRHPEWQKVEPGKQIDFYLELQHEQKKCQQLTRAAYLVKVHVPYLLEPISIDGLSLGDL